MHDTDNTEDKAGRQRAGRILVVGGYGDVGARVSELLAHSSPDRVVIGGRRQAAAEALAGRIGNGAGAVQVDIGDPSSIAAALDGVETVVVCLDDPAGLVLAEAVNRGLGYVDINADHQTTAAGRRLHARAAASGARAVLGIGLAPGVTNLLAASATRKVDDPTEVVVGVLLSLYDEFGPQALDYMLEAASRPFPEPRTGSPRLVTPYTEPRPVWFGPDSAHRQGRWFPFPDQFGFGETLGVQSAATLITLEPRWVDRTMATLATLGILRLSRRPAIRRVLTWLLMRLPGTPHPAPVKVSATVTSTTHTANVLLETIGESDATARALVTATTLLGTVDPGVWLPEQAFDPTTFLNELAAHPNTTITESGPASDQA